MNIFNCLVFSFGKINIIIIKQNKKKNMNNFEIFINIFLMVDLGDRRRDKQKKKLI
jgi:hypothetical protein